MYASHRIRLALIGPLIVCASPLAKLLPIRERHQKEDRTLINAGEILLVREIHTVSRGQRCLALHGRISVVATIAGPVAISERRFDRAHYYEIAPYLDPSRRFTPRSHAHTLHWWPKQG